MYRAPSKQHQRIKRIVVYGLMTTTVLSLVTILVFVMQGYRFNKETSTIEQGGLVQFNTRPTGANVTVGRAQLVDRTPSKITVNPGDYTVTMTKQGYHNWSKPVEVRAGQVLWLNYAQLVPTNIETEPVLELDAVADALASPNGDRYALLAGETKPEIEVIDIASDMPKRTSVSLRADQLRAERAVFNLVAWGSDSNRLLVTATSKAATHWLVMDRRNEDKTINISVKYGVDIKEAIFDPRSNDRIIIRTASGDVRIVDTSADTISSVIASSVTSMSPYMKTALLLVQQSSPTAKTVGYVSYGTSNVRQLQEIDNNEPTSVAGAEYFGDPYIAITNGTSLSVNKVRSLPSSNSDTSISMTNLLTSSLPAPASHLGLKAGGRFVIAQYGSGLLTYDIELQKQSNVSFTSAVKEELRWLDRYHFYLTNGAALEVLEFDGGNAHNITPLTTRFDVIQRSNGKYIYSINSANDKTFILQRSKMILDN